jgi:hypothetical protein
MMTHRSTLPLAWFLFMAVFLALATSTSLAILALHT